MNFVGVRRKFFVLSAVLLVASIILLFFPGLNLGIDFTGGTILYRQVDVEVRVAEIRQTLAEGVPSLGVDGGQIQILDRPNEFMLRTHELSAAQIGEVDEALELAFGGLVELRTDMVGPVIGSELIAQALWALVIASLGILAYVSIRFEYRYAVAAIAAAVHDIILVLGLFALTGRELNSPFVAAILTVIGYSINDTIVIFDRVRENMGYRQRDSVEEVVNSSLNQTLARTVNTSLTTFVVVLLLFIFGGASIQNFAFALMAGVIVGTYSSLFVAGPIWLEWKLWSDQKSKYAVSRRKGTA